MQVGEARSEEGRRACGREGGRWENEGGNNRREGGREGGRRD